MVRSASRQRPHSTSCCASTTRSHSRWSEARRERQTVYYRLSDQRIEAMIDLAASLLADNAEHVAACKTI